MATALSAATMRYDFISADAQLDSVSEITADSYSVGKFENPASLAQIETPAIAYAADRSK